MKSIWTIISTLALANLLAVVGFLGWLGASHRLSRDRIDAVRAVFASTLEQDQAQKAEADRKARADEDERAKADKLARPTQTAAEKIQKDQAQNELARQQRLREESEIRALQSFLTRENERLVKLEKDLQTRKDAFDAERKKIRETEGTEQFKRALATLAGMKAKEASQVLGELLTQNKHAEVIGYLNSMDERVRSKILEEFNKNDPKVAADLLEGLKTYGVIASVHEPK